MFRNYWLVAIRNFKRYKVHSTINVLGLSLGLAACILILLFVQDELSYDRFHENADRIYRIATEVSIGDRTTTWARVPFALGAELEEQFPEVVRVAKIVRYSYGPGTLVHYGKKQFYESGGYQVDKALFDVFSFTFLQGDQKTALTDPNSVVITQRLAKKYFEDEDPIGKVLRFAESSRDMTVTGVLKDVPHNSHLKFDFLISLANYRVVSGTTKAGYVYILLSSTDAANRLEPHLFQNSETVKKRKQYGIYRPYLQALPDIHLFSHLDYGELELNRDVGDLYLFSVIALLILVIACINYMNLATARSAHRAKEVSVRKVVGARQSQLVSQLLSESVLVTALAFILAIALAEIMLPIFNAQANTHLYLSYSDGRFWLCIVVLTVGVGVLSGSYPAFILSAFQPVAVLKGMSKVHPSSAWFRKGLVVFQFAASIGLMITTGIVFNQLAFVKNKALGFDKEQVVVIDADGIGGSSDPYLAFASGKFGGYDAFKSELLRNPQVLNVGASSSLLLVKGGYKFTRPYITEGKRDQIFDWETLFVDYDFVGTMGIQFRDGRDFSREFPTDLRDAVILNERAAQELGWENAIGKRIERTGFMARNSEIVGVVKDFHTQSLHHPIQPLVIGLFPPEAGHVSFFVVKIRTENVSETLAFLREKWRERAPDHPFNYSFLDEDYDALYRAEMQLLQIFGAFAGLAIFIACLGLFGLAAFMAEIRTKEIGIRKVLGASISSICVLLSKDFVKLVVLANLIAWPVAYYAMQQWLQNFAYRINLGVSIFLVAGVIAVTIALLTVSVQAIKTARMNPVNALRYE